MSKDLYMKDFNGEKIFSLEYDKETLKDMVLDLQNQLQQKENIIKEAIEYIEEKGRLKYKPDELLNILKGDSSNE